MSNATTTPFDPELIARLAASRISGADIDDGEAPGGVEAALAAQLAVLRILEQQGQTVSGWKVGLTSGGAYDMMGAGVRPFGYLLAERTLESGATLAGGAGMRLQLEPELCLQLKSDLRGSDLSAADCAAAVSHARAAFEINRMRVRMPGRNNLFVADGLGNWGTVLGGSAPVRPGLESTHVEVFRDGQPIGARAPGLVMDDPLLSLSRLCTALDRHGLGLVAGQHVITGAFFRCDLSQPGAYTARFADIGEVTLNIR